MWSSRAWKNGKGSGRRAIGFERRVGDCESTTDVNSIRSRGASLCELGTGSFYQDMVIILRDRAPPVYPRTTFIALQLGLAHGKEAFLINFHSCSRIIARSLKHFTICTLLISLSKPKAPAPTAVPTTRKISVMSLGLSKSRHQLPSSDLLSSSQPHLEDFPEVLQCMLSCSRLLYAAGKGVLNLFLAMDDRMCLVCLRHWICFRSYICRTNMLLAC